MVKAVPMRVLASCEYAARKVRVMMATAREKALKLRRNILIVLLAFMADSGGLRPAAYLSHSVRYRGIWRNWRDAGLHHLDDRAMIRFCGFPKHIVKDMAACISRDPDMASLCPWSRYFKRGDDRSRPICDVLDVVVLVLREICTMGHQHVLCTDMGIPMGSLTKYLKRGKKALLRMLRSHVAAEPRMLTKEEGHAAHAALEAQHGLCPREGVLFPMAIDGTVSQIYTPGDEEAKVVYYSSSKHVSGVNSILLVCPLGTVIAYNLCLPGNVPDCKAAEGIFRWLFDEIVNPFLLGVLADYGFTGSCNMDPRFPPVARPYQPTKDAPISDTALRKEVAELSRWICSCRQYNEWINGSAKRGFPRWTVKTHIRSLPQLRLDMEMYILLFNYRVRTCEWSQTRTVYLQHMHEQFQEQGLIYDEIAGCFIDMDPRADPPTDDDD